MLHKSGINLFSETNNFFEKEETIIIFSAYIKSDIIKKLNNKNNIKQIIVRWEIEDLVKGISDLDLYYYCKVNNIQLFRNTRIHLKTAWNFNDKMLLGSANYTSKGIGESQNFNYELTCTFENIKLSDKIYLNKILKSSSLIDDNYFEQLKEIVNSISSTKIIYPQVDENIVESKYYLLSELPMSLSPDDLYDVAIRSEDYESIDHNCAAHDIALYDINVFQEFPNFKIQLKDKFNSHPFVKALKNHIKTQETKSLRYGGVVEWIQKTTTTVPTPRSWEIKREQIVNILYTWICEFDDNFTWNIPGNRSEVIHYHGE